MKIFSILFFCCINFFFPAGTIYGQGFTGQGRPVTVSQPITVAEAGNLPLDSWVILTGYIVSSLPGGRHYTFRDSTGEITVEIKWDVWRGLSAGPSDRVTIYGELESNRGRISIEVEAITGQGRIRRGQAVTITEPVTVAEALNLPRNSWVTLSGYIIRRQRDEYYTFRDSTGEITVEIDRDVWRGLSVDASDRVVISGEVEIERRQVTVDVKAIRKL